MEIMTLLESGDVRLNSCHSFWKNLSPIIMVQWKIGTRNERGNDPIGDTPILSHFPLNHDYGRKGSDTCRIKPPGCFEHIKQVFLQCFHVFFLKNKLQGFTSIYCRSETVTDPVR